MDSLLNGPAPALAVCFAIYKFVPNNVVKAMALGVAGVVIAKNIPFVQDGLK